jgi:uncharacterized protein (UPF0333 family)
MDSKAQTSVEYLLLIASAIVFVVITVAIVREYVYTPGLSDVNGTAFSIKNLTNSTLT